MTQIGADRAWREEPGLEERHGRRLDTGVDDQHPDLKANFDASKSASCAYGKADTRPGRGARSASTVRTSPARSPRPGTAVGMIGVAPGVKVSSIRVAEAGQPAVLPENTVCAFMFAADKGVSVTNNSYYVDPWLFRARRTRTRTRSPRRSAARSRTPSARVS
jgi:subtilisin family serine protease